MWDLVGNLEDRFSHDEAQMKVVGTVMIISFRTDVSGQTVQTQIRLLLEEQSDQSLHCLLFHLHFLEAFLCSKANMLEF